MKGTIYAKHERRSKTSGKHCMAYGNGAQYATDIGTTTNHLTRRIIPSYAVDSRTEYGAQSRYAPALSLMMCMLVLLQAITSANNDQTMDQ